jgi:hypothetical protein
LAQAIYPAESVKVHEAAVSEMAHAKIGRRLHFVHRENGGYGLDFQE